MSKVFECDKCGAKFPQPIDEELFIDEHGVEHIFDLCAPCRKKIKDEVKKANSLSKLVKEKK